MYTDRHMLYDAGNPFNSVEVYKLQRGYAKDCREKGFLQLSARPWTEAELIEVMKYLEATIANISGIKQLLLYRDGLILSILWTTGCRGANAGSFRLENVRLPKGVPTGPCTVWNTAQMPGDVMNKISMLTEYQQMSGRHQQVALLSPGCTQMCWQCLTT